MLIRAIRGSLSQQEGSVRSVRSVGKSRSLFGAAETAAPPGGVFVPSVGELLFVLFEKFVVVHLSAISFNVFRGRYPINLS